MLDREINIFIIGFVSLLYIIKILKNYYKELRPNNSIKTYGMPSSRSAVLVFMLVFFLLMNKKMSTMTQSILYLSTFLGIYLKYHINEHSIKQLFIGGVIGGFYAYLLIKYFL